MARSSWRKKQARSVQPAQGRSRNRETRQRFNPHIETLEDRCLLDCTASDVASLTDCIEQFDTGTNSGIINLTAGTYALDVNLPPITAPGTTIKGPPSAVPQACIQRDANSMATVGLTVLGGTSNVANLCIGSFTDSIAPGTGLALGTNGNDTVQNCYLGFGYDANTGGIVPMPNTEGMEIVGAVSNNTIGGTMAGQGNVIANNVDNGLEIQSGSTHNEIIGNFIGTDQADTPNEGNGTGLKVESDLNTIGGTVANYRNLVSGNQGIGIWLNGSHT